MTENSGLRREFIRFSIVGALGFLVDYFIVLLCVRVFAMHPLLARLFSFAGAASFTWLLNRAFTFAARINKGGEACGLLPYMAAMLLGMAVNYAAYAFCLYFLFPRLPFPITQEFALLLAVSAGSCAGLLVNFFACNKFLFKTPHS